jgi:uncharacterized protein YydD (DUF2326 family)
MWLDNILLYRVITISSNVEDTGHTGIQGSDSEGARSQSKDEHYLLVQCREWQGGPFTEHVEATGEGVKGAGR